MLGLRIIDDRSIIIDMSKEDTRAELIATGMKEMLLGGYDSVGIASVLSKSGVPKGSFYYYFESKEDFGKAVVEAYASEWRSVRQATFSQTDQPPLDRLRAHFLDLEEDVMRSKGMGGCLLGNLAQIMASRNEALRVAVARAFEQWEEDIRQVLREAQEAQELARDLDLAETAALIIESYEGALIRAKTLGSRAPLERFRMVALPKWLGL